MWFWWDFRCEGIVEELVGFVYFVWGVVGNFFFYVFLIIDYSLGG